jgi:hypothetical protein
MVEHMADSLPRIIHELGRWMDILAIPGSRSKESRITNVTHAPR